MPFSNEMATTPTGTNTSILGFLLLNTSSTACWINHGSAPVVAAIMTFVKLKNRGARNRDANSCATCARSAQWLRERAVLIFFLNKSQSFRCQTGGQLLAGRCLAHSFSALSRPPHIPNDSNVIAHCGAIMAQITEALKPGQRHAFH